MLSYIEFTRISQKFKYINIYFFCKTPQNDTEFRYAVRRNNLYIKHNQHIVHRFLQGYIKNLIILSLTFSDKVPNRNEVSKDKHDYFTRSWFHFFQYSFY